MILFLCRKKAGVSFSAVVSILIISLVISVMAMYVHSPSSNSYAAVLSYMPAPTELCEISPDFNPSLLRGVKIHPEDPFKFDFIIDQGDSALTQEELNREKLKLIR